MSARERGGGFRLGCGVVFVLLVVCAAYLGMLYISAQSIGASVAEASNDAQNLTNAISDLDLERASLSSTRMRDNLADASQRMNNWEWTIASRLPVLSSDVAIMRDAIGVATRASNDAVEPLVRSLRGMTSSTDVASIISAITSDTGVVASAVQAHDVIDACVDDAGKLGTSRFEQVNDGVAQLRESLTGIDEVLDVLVGGPQDLANSLAALGDELTSTGEQAAA